MNAGPQIMSAIIFFTASKPIKLSAYFVAGVVIAVSVGVTVTYTLATVLGNSLSLGDPFNSGSLGNILQYVLVGLLIILSLRSYLTRATSEPPRRPAPCRRRSPGGRSLRGCFCFRCSPPTS